LCKRQLTWMQWGMCCDPILFIWMNAWPNTKIFLRMYPILFRQFWMRQVAKFLIVGQLNRIWAWLANWYRVRRIFHRLYRRPLWQLSPSGAMLSRMRLHRALFLSFFRLNKLLEIVIKSLGNYRIKNMQQHYTFPLLFFVLQMTRPCNNLFRYSIVFFCAFFLVSLTSSNYINKKIKKRMLEFIYYFTHTHSTQIYVIISYILPVLVEWFMFLQLSCYPLCVFDCFCCCCYPSHCAPTFFIL